MMTGLITAKRESVRHLTKGYKRDNLRPKHGLKNLGNHLHPRDDFLVAVTCCHDTSKYSSLIARHQIPELQRNRSPQESTLFPSVPLGSVHYQRCMGTGWTQSTTWDPRVISWFMNPLSFEL